MPRYRVTYWNVIPQSFIVEGDGRRVRKEMPQNVQVKIDAFAMATDLTSSDDYTGQYRRGEWIERNGSAEEIAEQLLIELQAVAAAIAIPKRSERTPGRGTP